MDAAFRSPATIARLAAATAAGSMFPAYFLAPSRGCLSARSARELHVPESSRFPPRIFTLEPVTPACTRDSRIALRLSLPLGNSTGFPPISSLRIKELDRSTTQVTHLGTEPDFPFLPSGFFIVDATGSSFGIRYSTTRLAVPSNLLEPPSYCALDQRSVKGKMHFEQA